MPLDDSALIEVTLALYNVPAGVDSRMVGPSFTRYMLTPGPGVRARRVRLLADDLAIALGVERIRIDYTADGIALEVPRDDPQPVPLAPIMAEADWPRSPIAYAVGRDVAGRPVVADLARMPHLIIAGATGTGKSVALNVLLASMLLRSSPHQLRLVLIDAKRVEMAPFAGLPHLWRPIITDVEPAERALADLGRLMAHRYALLERHGVRNVGELARPVPRYVCVVDELADLVMASKAIRDHLVRLAQKSRAAGIHLVLATQRPSADVISGLLKANVPGRMALATVSGVDSRVVLDVSGAEDLLGRGDMLFKPPWELEPIRLQGAYVSDAELAAIVARWPSVVPEPAGRPVTARDGLWGMPVREVARRAVLLALLALFVAAVVYLSVS